MNGYVSLKNAIYHCEDMEWEFRYSDKYLAAVYGEAAWRMRQILSQNWEYFKQY